MQLRRHWKLADLAQAAVQSVGLLQCAVDELRPGARTAFGRQGRGDRLPGGRRRHLPGQRANSGGIGLPASRQMLEQLVEIVRRRIQHDKRRKALWRDKGIQGPTRHAVELCREGLQGIVQTAVEFTVDLDRDEIAVEQSGYLRVLVAFALHDVAPVAGEVAHRNEQQLVFTLGAGEGVGIPFLPGHRVVAMQGQVRRGMVYKLIDRVGCARRNGQQQYKQQGG